MELTRQIGDTKCDAILIAHIKSKYEALQERIDAITLDQLRQKKFENVMSNFESMLGMLKYFITEDPNVKQKVYFKRTNTSTNTHTTHDHNINALDNNMGTRYIMFFLKENLNCNIACIRFGEVAHSKDCSNKILADLLCVLEGNVHIKRFVLRNRKSFNNTNGSISISISISERKKKFSHNAINSIIKSLALAQSHITKLAMDTSFDRVSATSFNNFLKGNDTIKSLSMRVLAHKQEEIQHVDLSAIANCKGMQKLNLINIAINEKLLQHVVIILNANVLTELDLLFCALNDAALYTLSCVLATNTKLLRINLIHAGMGITAIEPVLNFLTQNKVLQHVNLSGNLICKNNRYELLTALVGNNTIRSFSIMCHLLLPYVKATSVLCETLCDILKTNVQLEKLCVNFSDTYKDPIFFSKLVAILNDNLTIKQLELDNYVAPITSLYGAIAWVNSKATNFDNSSHTATIKEILQRNVDASLQPNRKSARKI